MSYLQTNKVIVPELPDPNEVIITSDRQMGPRHTILITISLSDITKRRFPLIHRYDNKKSY